MTRQEELDTATGRCIRPAEYGSTPGISVRPLMYAVYADVC
jgi:hypothetical protein